MSNTDNQTDQFFDNLMSKFDCGERKQSSTNNLTLASNQENIPSHRIVVSQMDQREMTKVHRANNKSDDKLSHVSRGDQIIRNSCSNSRHSKSRRDMLQNISKSQLKLFKDVVTRPNKQSRNSGEHSYDQKYSHNLNQRFASDDRGVSQGLSKDALNQRAFPPTDQSLL